MTFATLGLSPELLLAVAARQYTLPTAVQTEAIPAVLAGQDVMALAQTGSGKTAAFALPLLQRLQQDMEQDREEGSKEGSKQRKVKVLVLVPTRELSGQVGQTIEALAGHLPKKLKVAVIYGGASINPQMMHLRGGADVVISTPGRLLDLLDNNALSLQHVSTLVLDEADRLLDLGFADEIKRILEQLPAQRQNLFFSATFSPAVKKLALALLHEPKRIAIEDLTENLPDIAQRAIAVDGDKRTRLLVHLIKEQQWERVLVFVATKYASDTVSNKLKKAGIKAEAFNGDASQGARQHMLTDFKANRIQVLVATDLAARGIDVAGLPAVVNYDLPRSADDYIHRIGRTGRAGASGSAISFILAEHEMHFRLIEKRQDKRVSRETLAGFEPSQTAGDMTPAESEAPTGGIKGKRKSKKDKLRELAAQNK
ncbi:DEAD/DEAH box helicase [Undibacterium pigrum]|uniref:Superfamily II DNA/RNA helicase n=1 Tax=Undibacterium pigrum TaxID=401470 RepID=A0A318J2V9_9BURK|nr:DEAD/DEAH box helicase [Undibacterium pigrum]PXX42050.1 superfamily II DNA/RNA helicase [Undibacterium pigrum]